MPLPQDIFAPAEAETHLPAALRPALAALAGVARDIARRIARGPLAAGDGDGAALAGDLFATALHGQGLRWLLSAHTDCGPVPMDAGGALALALTPLEGAATQDANVPLGTLFSLYPARDDPRDSYLRPGREQCAGGYVIYGPQCCLVLSCGAGTLLFRLDPDSGRFGLVRAGLRLPQQVRELALGAARDRPWPRPLRGWIDADLAARAPGGPVALRWIGPVVAETHRILMRGGVFLSPMGPQTGAAGGTEPGLLPLIHSCAPVALVIEQAGGRATDGAHAMLARRPAHLAEQAPLVFGPADRVDRIAADHDLPDQEVSALFGTRGLFRD